MSLNPGHNKHLSDKTEVNSEKRIPLLAEDPLLQQSLQFGHALQATLDVYDVIKRFYKELSSIVKINSFQFNNSETGHGFEMGKICANQLQYNLSIDKDKLGSLVISRKAKFTEQEIVLVENAITSLVYPLRNSIKYHEAILNSYTDTLTKIGNRTAFNNSLQREMEFAKRHQTSLNMLVIDVDNFKNINDNFGHQAGDYILAQLAKILVKLNRTSDMVFRYGGEEFIILLSNTKNKGALHVANRICSQVANSDFIYNQQAIEVTVSIGISEYNFQESADQLFRRADQNLYKAKNAGKNQAHG